ncbi:MAG: preprotein translocase subunit SecG [Epsilonproteobacteria bacterium]|nr:preprotein translocase subunit SecG [Campylobacterota bacterium]
MTSTLIALQIILAVVITALVLMQKSSSIGLGAYSGSNDSLFGAKGPVNFLQKATFVIGLLFVINTLSLVYIYNQQKTESVLDKVQINKNNPIPSAPVK